MPDLQPARISKRPPLREYLANRHATTDQVGRRFYACGTLETARKKASRSLNAERRRKRVRLAGAVLLTGSGRPTIVYGPPCKPDILEHEVWITEAELLLGIEFERGVSVGETQADGMFVRDGTRFFVEVDHSAKMSSKQMRAKWQRYEGVEGFILVVSHKESRMRKLLSGAELVKDLALFSTFSRLGTCQPWIDWYGKSVVMSLTLL
jgi:hypothetical protein